MSGRMCRRTSQNAMSRERFTRGPSRARDRGSRAGPPSGSLRLRSLGMIRQPLRRDRAVIAQRERLHVRRLDLIEDIGRVVVATIWRSGNSFSELLEQPYELHLSLRVQGVIEVVEQDELRTLWTMQYRQQREHDQCAVSWRRAPAPRHRGSRSRSCFQAPRRWEIALDGSVCVRRRGPGGTSILRSARIPHPGRASIAPAPSLFSRHRAGSRWSRLRCTPPPRSGSPATGRALHDQPFY